MRSYAGTWPQLVAQARAAELDHDTLGDLRRAYELSQAVFDGYHRGCGEPFECHMVRTASVALHEGQDPPLIRAALLHSAYNLHRYDHSTRRAPRSSHRRLLQQEIGSDAEAIVWGFTHLEDWPREVKVHLDDVPAVGTIRHQALTLHVANELVNHLDLGMAYRSDYPYRERVEAHGDAMSALARALGYPIVADELTALFAEHLDLDLPPAVLGRRRPYELPPRRPWQGVGAERAAWKVRQTVRRNRRRVARRVVPGSLRRARP